MVRFEGLSLPDLRQILGGDFVHLAAESAILGVLLHHTILRPLYVETFMYQLLALPSLSFIGLVYVYLQIGLSSIDILARIAIISASFNGGIFFSIITYRVFFHRLRSFPGPFLARISKFFSVYLAAKNVQYHNEVAKMQEKYGDFIRTGPREICIVRKSAVAQIYGPNAECRKASWYGQVDQDYKNCSINMTRNVEDYRRRRRNWDRGFSIKVLNTYEPRVRAKCDLFVSQLEKANCRPLDATAWSNYLAFDIMGEVGFGKDFGGVSKGQEHRAIKGIHDHMNVLGIMSHVPWLLNLGSRIPGATAGYAPFFRWCAAEIKAKQRDWKPGESPNDIVSWLVKAFEEKDVSASPSEAALHEDSRVVIIAGSETTATTMAQVLFYLAKYPAVLKKLQAKVDAAMPTPADWSYEKVKGVTYIDDIINESLRLKPALLTGSYRLTPPQGIQVDERYIPGDTNVFVPTQLVQRDPRYWKRGEEFIPERFGEKRGEMGTDGAPFMPFTLGMHACPGKNLALISLRIVLSKIAHSFNVKFAPGETGEGFDVGAKETFTTTLPPVMLQFPRRQ